MSRQIVDYKIIERLTREGLQSDVENYVRYGSGWKPLGGVATEGLAYYQAMVKYEDAEPRVDVSPKVFAPSSEGG